MVEKALEWSPEGSTELRRQILDGLEARRYQRQIEENQLRFLSSFLQDPLTIEAGGLEVLDRRTYLLNMLLVRAPDSEVDRLRGLKEVQAVYANQKRYPLLDSAPFLIEAPVLWEALGGVGQAGQGMKIGIIDSGISQEHPMFSGEGLSAPVGFPLGDSASTNNKVIVARTYVKPEFGLKEQDNKTPEDELGHGSRVASVAAGRSVATSAGTIQGVAPVAFLGNYKVFGSPSVNPTTTSAAVIAAIEDAVQDGMDVINLSLGGPARDPTEDPEQRAIAMAVEAGVVVVTAAGNAGPDPGTITSPGTSPDAITVGATSNARVFASALEITSDSSLPPELEKIPYVPGTGETISEPVGPLPMVSVVPLDATELACSPLPPESLAGEVVLVRRGNCFFSTKAKNVFDAAAEGMVVYNNVPDSAVVMSGLDGIEQPAVMIGQAAGEALRDFLIAGTQARITFRAVTENVSFPTQPDLVANFSSRGPNIDLQIKPDLMAPGENIHTASNLVTPEPQFSLRTSGTSFATPMVSGAAALMKQLHPDWVDRLSAGELARAIKSTLVNTAVKSTLWRGESARLIHTGNGRLDLAQAVKASAVLDPVSVSFGLVSEDVSSHLERQFNLTNLESEFQMFQVEWFETVKNPTVEISIFPSAVALSPGETGQLTLSADLVSPLTGGTFEGFIGITSSNQKTQLSAAYWGGVTVEDDSVTLQVTQSGGAAFSTLASAIEAAQPGYVIEIADDATYPEVLTIRHNADGLDLNGLILRGAPGNFPTLDARELTATEAAVTVSELERVTIEGLNIEGGLHGISYQNATGVIRNNIIENTLQSRASHGIELVNSRAHIFGNSIKNNGGSGIAAFASSALIQQNQIGGDEAGNQENGISASPGSQLGVFENQIINNGGGQLGGQGIRLSNAQALIRGNTIGNTQGSLGDGIWARGASSRVSILDNLIEGSGRYGIFLTQEAEAALQRNQIQKNQAAGLRLEEGAGAEIHSTRFLGNGAGVQSLSSTVELSDSLIVGSAQPAQGDGIFAAGGALKVHNSTVFGNTGFGIRLSGVGHTVFNSILDQNSAGELSDVSSDAFTNNLIADGQLEGLNGNFAASPMFTDPLNLDFSLRQGSPAIDRGSDELAVSSLDLLSHERAVDGDGDGKAQVDLGAIEFGSDFWSPLILPVLSTNQAEIVGLAVANTFHEPATVLFRAYDPDGKLVETLELPEVLTREQLTLLLNQALNTLQEGWIEILSTTPELMSFAALGNQSLSFLAGVQLSPALSNRLVFPEVRSQGEEETRFYLVNPNVEEVEVSLSWIRSEGVSLEKTFQLVGKGMLTLTFEEIFGQGSAGFVTATVETGESIFGMEIFGFPESRGGLLALDQGASSSTLFAAYFASGEEMVTTVNLINTGSETQVTLEALDDDGKVIQSFVLDQLPAGGQFLRSVRDIFNFPLDQVTGWLRIQAGTGGLLGTISFSDPAGEFLATLPLPSEGAREFIFSYLAQDSEIFTGVALLNLSSDDVLVSAEIFDGDGQPRGISFLELAAGQQVTRLVNEFFPDLQAQRGGFLRIRSSGPVTGFEIFADYSLSFFTAVPQQVLAP